ncbi:rCG54437, partial [Rattus norvegicus]
MPWRSGGPP